MPRSALSKPSPVVLLELHGGAGLFELLLDLFGLVLGSGLLDGLRRAVHDLFGLFQTQAGDRANDLDDLDLLVANSGEDDIDVDEAPQQPSSDLDILQYFKGQYQ